MTHPLVGLLGIAIPLLVGSASAATAGDDFVFARHLDKSAAPVRMKADDDKEGAAPKLKPVFVKLTPVETDPKYTRLASALDSTARAAIGNIPGVTVLRDDDDAVAVAKKSHKPVVILSGKLQNMATSKDGDQVEFSAQVQYIIYRIPSRDIAAVVDGGAKTRISAVQGKSKESRQQVEDDVAAAAVESAARRAPAALLAISKH